MQQDNDRSKKNIRENNKLTDQLVKLTIGQGKEYEKVLFLADPHFLFLIPDAHLAHFLLTANTQAKRQSKSQRAKLPMLWDNWLISKVVFRSKKGNNLVTL
jgi:hypothetical protein